MVIAMNEYLPHDVSELICVRCGFKYIGLYPENTQLKNLECKQCGERRYLIKNSSRNNEE